MFNKRKNEHESSHVPLEHVRARASKHTHTRLARIVICYIMPVIV